MNEPAHITEKAVRVLAEGMLLNGRQDVHDMLLALLALARLPGEVAVGDPPCDHDAYTPCPPECAEAKAAWRIRAAAAIAREQGPAPETPARFAQETEGALNQGPRQADGVGSNPDRLRPDRLSVEPREQPCTCHPDDNPPVPCARKYALTECRHAAELAEDRRLSGSSWERVDADGSRHRIDPRRVFIDAAPPPETPAAQNAVQRAGYWKAEHLAANAVIDRLGEFVERVSRQKPEKPDYWSSCGQCEHNISDAEDLLPLLKSPETTRDGPSGLKRGEDPWNASMEEWK
jgi:hypothetical protein